MNDYEDGEEFDEIRTFFSYVSQIFGNAIENFVGNKKININQIENVLDCLVYEYGFCGFSIDENKNDFLILGKIVDDNDNEYLYLPIPITKTDDWYNRLKQINSSRL